MKIMMVTNNYTPYSGGVVSSIDATAHALRKNGHHVIIVTLDFVGEQNTEPDVVRLACPIKFTYKKNPMALPWRAETVLYNLVVQHKPDIIHSHHPFLLGVAAIKVARKVSIPIVFTHHTMYEKYVHYVPLPVPITEPVVKTLVQAYCNQVDGIIVPSLALRNNLREQQINTLINVIPSSILPIFMHPEFVYKPLVNHRPIELLTVSRFTPEKNIKLLLDAYSLLDTQQYNFTLIGFGAQLEELQHYAYHELNLSPTSVQFIIKPAKEIIAQWYKNADIFIFASQTETQGLVLAEAMAAGTPVIALTGTGVDDMVIDGQNGYLVDSAQQMAQKIAFLRNNNKLSQEFQQQAWQTAQKCNSYDLAHRVYEFYYSICQNTGK